MRWGLPASLVLHGAILGAALFVLPSPDEFKVSPQDAIQVDISKIEDVSKRKATVKAEEKPIEKPLPKKIEEAKKAEPAPKIAEEVKKAVKEPVAEPEPPEPKKDEPKKAEADPLKDLIKTTVSETPEPKKEEPKKEETKKAEVKPKEKPKKPEKKKPKLNPDEIAAFLNKIDEDAAPAPEFEKTAEPDLAEANLQGTDDTLSADIVDALRQKLASCWSVPPGAREANIIVKVRFTLNPDGSVQGLPEVLNASSDMLFGATAQSAVSAVMECQSYDFLPREKYDLWKDITINFNPNMMFQT